MMDILVFNSAGNGGTVSFLDHIGMFAKYTRHRTFYHNFIYDFDPEMDLNGFDVIVIMHNIWPEAITPERREKIRRAPGLKVMFLQDEYQCVRPINALLEEMGIQVMFTCVSQSYTEKFYPKSIMQSLMHVEPTLTGFVPDYLTEPGIFASGERSYDVGYRSRISPYYLGHLGNHKRLIAEKFQDICPRNGLRHNISVAEDDRLFGKQWINFLRSCRTQLGTPSGSSVIDFDDTLINAEAEFRRENPHSTFEDFHERYLGDHEGKVIIDTVSPRVFESAAAGSTMVMLEGYYGGILEAGVHYIPISGEYGNIPEVVEQVKDRDYCSRIAKQAHDHLIASENFTYEKFVRRFEEILDEFVPHRPQESSIDPGVFNKTVSDEHNQCMFFGEQGHYYDQSKAGRVAMRKQWLADVCYRLPFAGRAFRRVGGDPIAKLSKARAAFYMARRNKPLKQLMIKWLSNKELRSSTSFDNLLKDILLLAVVKSGQGHCALAGNWFRTSIIPDGEERLILTANAVAADYENPTEPSHLSFKVPPKAEILLDLTDPFPPKKFANAIILVWPIYGQSRTLRSGADEYFHLKALCALAEHYPFAVQNALRWAIEVPGSAEKKQLETIFGMVF